MQNPLDPRSIKIYDFGLARVLNEGESATEDCGSLGYTAPELLRREPYGVEVDMFSAGVIMFFVLSGYRPFNVPGAGRAEVKQKIINCEYTMDQTRWNRVSAEAQHLVRSLLVQRDSEYHRRLTALEALEHEWLREDEATRINLTQFNLNQNATYIETGEGLEPQLSQHSFNSTRSVSLEMLLWSCQDSDSLVSNLSYQHSPFLLYVWILELKMFCPKFVWNSRGLGTLISWYRKWHLAVAFLRMPSHWSITLFNPAKSIRNGNAGTYSLKFSKRLTLCISGM